MMRRTRTVRGRGSGAPRHPGGARGPGDRGHRPAGGDHGPVGVGRGSGAGARARGTDPPGRPGCGDDRYLERLAREQLGMLRPDEVELVLVPSAGRDSGTPGNPRPGQDTAPPGRSVWDWAERLRGLVARWLWGR